MTRFYEREIETAVPGTDKKEPKIVLFFEHGNFDGRATDEHKSTYAPAYQAYLDSKDPEKIAEAKAKLIAEKEKELEALKGESK